MTNIVFSCAHIEYKFAMSLQVIRITLNESNIFDIKIERFLTL